MPPWPAWDWSPSGHRGVTLVLHYWGVAVRKKSHRSFPVPGKGLLLPGLLSGVVPTASVPATATYLVLLSPELDGGRRVPCREDLSLSHPGCSALHYGDWRVIMSQSWKPYYVGSGCATVGWRRSAVSVSFGRVLR